MQIITPCKICIILQIIRKPNPIFFYHLFNYSSLKNVLNSVDVKFPSSFAYSRQIQDIRVSEEMFSQADSEIFSPATKTAELTQSRNREISENVCSGTLI